MVEINRAGINYADNIVDNVLSFNGSESWAISSGTGTAIIENTLSYEGNSCLRIENNTPSNDIVATNTIQNTVIPRVGNYDLSFYLRKKEADYIINGNVKIFKNAALLDTQSFSLGSETTSEDKNSVWVRFTTNEDYSFVTGDVVTFTFQIDGDAGTPPSIVQLFIDGFMLYNKERQQLAPPVYSLPSSTKEGLEKIHGFFDYNDSGTIIPVTVAGSPVAITNNGLGSNTIKIYAPEGVTDIWDSTLDVFDWSQLNLGDTIDIRLEFVLDTSSVNTQIEVCLHLGTGGGAYQIPFLGETNFKNTGTRTLSVYNSIYLGDLNTLNNGGQFRITTDKDCSITSNGWYCKIIRRTI